MSGDNLRALGAAAVGSLLVWGVVRAATNGYQQRRDALFATCREEQNRQKLTREQLRAKYPTPEQMLCQIARLTPGAVGEVSAKGKFAPGTKFLFSNDKIDLVNETLSATQYRARLKVAEGSGPDVLRLEAYQPLTCDTVACEAARIGGKYEWDFIADNGWRVKLRSLQPGERADLYCGEFYRPGEPKPFKQRRIEVGGNERGYHGAITQQEGCASSSEDSQAEMQKLMEKMAKSNELPPKEQEKLMARIQELSERQSKEMQTQIAKMSNPQYQAELQREQQEFGCHGMDFWIKGEAFEGNLGCGEKVGKPGSLGRLALKGSMKYLGP